MAPGTRSQNYLSIFSAPTAAGSGTAGIFGSQTMLQSPRFPLDCVAFCSKRGVSAAQFAPGSPAFCSESGVSEPRVAQGSGPAALFSSRQWRMRAPPGVCAQPGVCAGRWRTVGPYRHKRVSRSGAKKARKKALFRIFWRISPRKLFTITISMHNTKSARKGAFWGFPEFCEKGPWPCLCGVNYSDTFLKFWILFCDSEVFTPLLPRLFTKRSRAL